MPATRMPSLTEAETLAVLGAGGYVLHSGASGATYRVYTRWHAFRGTVQKGVWLGITLLFHDRMPCERTAAGERKYTALAIVGEG